MMIGRKKAQNSTKSILNFLASFCGYNFLMTKLGILDWGIGGIGVYKLIKEQLGDVGVVYFSDTGTTPYGKMTKPELVARLNEVIAFLKTQRVTHLLIGCNAASTAIPFLKTDGITIEGVIDNAVRTTAKLKPKRLGVIGGRRTILSGVYRKAFTKRGLPVEQRIAQPLSGLIESGDTSSEKLKTEAEQILTPLKNCSHILLACTHYPAIENVLREYVSPKTNFIDPASGLVEVVRKWKLSPSDEIFLTTGDAPMMKTAAMKAFGFRMKNVKQISI
jgi:glutamate racemase